MRFLLRHQFVRFLLVGALNSCVGYVLYACLLYVGLPYAAASLGALMLGILVSFHTQGALVFGNQNRRLVIRFAASWGVIYLANVALIGTLIHVGMGAYGAGIVALVPTTILSYLTQKFVVFRETPRHNVSGS